jgi:hypothetical protein
MIDSDVALPEKFRVVQIRGLRALYLSRWAAGGLWFQIYRILLPMQKPPGDQVSGEVSMWGKFAERQRTDKLFVHMRPCRMGFP